MSEDEYGFVLTWNIVATRMVAVGVPIIASILGFMLVQGWTWGKWVTISLGTIQSDVRLLKVANGISLVAPNLGGDRKEPQLSLFGPDLPARPEKRK